METLRNIARINQLDPDTIFPPGTRLTDEEMHEINVCLLFTPKWRKTTLFLWVAWLGMAFTYYGNIMVVTFVFSNLQEDLGDQNNNGTENTLYSFEYVPIFMSALSELLGLFVALMTIDRCGRISTQAVSYIVGGSAVLALTLLSLQVEENDVAMTIVSILARGAFNSGSCVLWISTGRLLDSRDYSFSISILHCSFLFSFF
jgi:hypothetical protein